MVLDPIPQPLPVHLFGSRPQPPTSPPRYLGAQIQKYRVNWVYHTTNVVGRSDTAIPLGVKLKARTSLLPRFNEKRRSNFERWAFETSFENLEWHSRMRFHERWGAGVETQKNVRGEIGGWGGKIQQSHLRWHSRMMFVFKSSTLKARTSLFIETWQKRRSSFELELSEITSQVGLAVHSLYLTWICLPIDYLPAHLNKKKNIEELLDTRRVVRHT